MQIISIEIRTERNHGIQREQQGRIERNHSDGFQKGDHSICKYRWRRDICGCNQQRTACRCGKLWKGNGTHYQHDSWRNSSGSDSVYFRRSTENRRKGTDSRQCIQGWTEALSSQRQRHEAKRGLCAARCGFCSCQWRNDKADDSGKRWGLLW